MIRLVAILLVVAFVVVVAQREAGYDGAHAVMLLLALASVAVACLFVHRGAGARWPADRSVRRAGARDEVSTLSWSFFGRDSTVSSKGMHTLREITAGRLQHHGLDLNDPADAEGVRALLGADVYAILHGAPPDVRQLRRCIDALERVAPPAQPGPATRTAPPTSTAPATGTAPATSAASSTSTATPTSAASSTRTASPTSAVPPTRTPS